MIRINQRLLSTCRLVHVSRDNGVGRHLPFVHQLLSNVETKMKIYAKIVCTCLKLMILGMIYSKIYGRKVSLKSIKQTQYQWQFLINWSTVLEEPIRVVKQFDSTLKYVLFTIVCVCGGEPKTYLPTYPPLLSIGRPTAIKDIFKSGLTPKDVF